MNWPDVLRPQIDNAKEMCALRDANSTIEHDRFVDFPLEGDDGAAGVKTSALKHKKNICLSIVCPLIMRKHLPSVNFKLPYYNYYLRSQG